MFKNFKILILFFIMIFTLSSCGSNANNNTANKVKVVVSFNAMREFTEAVGGNKVNVITIVPNGTEPHTFEPKIKDFQDLGDAKVFVYNGLGMEKWADKAVQAVDNKNLVVVNASKGYSALKSSSTGEGEYDPHLWIGLKGAEKEAENIRDGLIKADPDNKTYYESNCTAFVNKIDTLYSEYKTKLSALPNKNFVTGHAAFGYLCKDLDLKQSSVEDVFADGEPGSKKMEELITYCKANNIKTIFVEEMVSPKVSETLAKEVGASAKKIYTNESQEDNLDYLQAVKANLENIYNSLK